MADPAQIEALRKHVHDVEHESVLRAIPRPVVTPDLPMPTPATEPRRAETSAEIVHKPARLGANKALFGWLLLGLVAIALAATIPR